MRSDNKPQQLSIGGRRRLAISLAGLAAAPAVLLAACGNADHKGHRTTGLIPGPARREPSSQPSRLRSRIRACKAPNNGIPPEDLVSQQGVGERTIK